MAITPGMEHLDDLILIDSKMNRVKTPEKQGSNTPVDVFFLGHPITATTA